MLADLFLITDPATTTPRSTCCRARATRTTCSRSRALGVHYNDLLDHATNCEIPALAGSVLECRASAPLHVWGQLDYQTRKADGDIEAGDVQGQALHRPDRDRRQRRQRGDPRRQRRHMSPTTPATTSSATMSTATACRSALYGVYDPGAFYVKAMTTYSWFDGDSRRHINFAGLGTGSDLRRRRRRRSGRQDVDLRPAWRRQVPDGRHLGDHAVPQPRLCLRQDGRVHRDGRRRRRA